MIANNVNSHKRHDFKSGCYWDMKENPRKYLQKIDGYKSFVFVSATQLKFVTSNARKTKYYLP